MSLQSRTSEILSALASAPAEGEELKELARALGLSRHEVPELRATLLELMRAGQVVRREKRYALPTEAPESPEAEVGILRVTAQGRGFVDLGEAFEEVMVASGDQGAAIDGDTVAVQSWPGTRRREGRVIRVVARGRTRLTGTLRRGKPPRLEPDDPRLPLAVLVLDLGPARPGQTVLAAIESYPTHRGAPLSVRITRALGEPGRLKTEVARATAGAGIEEEFPAASQREAAHAAPTIREGQREDRLDLRHLRFVTIDPRTARDFDDAVAVEPLSGSRLRVWVAVADVSEYVEEGSALDQEARARGCSIYLPDRAIPMLPHELSSGICSLVPGEDRLAMVVRLDLTPQGRVVGSDAAAAVIHSHGRLDYGGVAAALGGDFRGRRADYREHLQSLEQLQHAASALRRQRLARGSLDLDLPEAEVILDEDDPDRVRDIRESRASAPVKAAYNLIEELMVAANEAVGRTLEAAGQETLWRIHPAPEPDALAKLALLVGSYGVSVNAATLRTPRSMARLLAHLRGHRAERALSYLVLRALKQASYSVENVGHFGLASASYLHFTSPIRRYPDLHVHRLLKLLLRQQGKPAGRALATRQTDRRALQAIARESSAAERKAIEVEREVQSVYAASLMRDRLGEEAHGQVTSVTPFGFFVGLTQPFVEGLVKLERLREWLDYLPEEARIIGRRSGHTYSLGDRVKVRVLDTSVTRRQVDFDLLEAEPSAPESSELERLRSKRRADRSRGRVERADRPWRQGAGRRGRQESGRPGRKARKTRR